MGEAPSSGQQVPQAREAVEHVAEAGGEGRQPDADEVGTTKVTEDTGVAQREVQALTLGVSDRDVVAAAGGGARRREAGHSPSAMPFARMAPMPASATRPTPSSAATSDTIGGVPARKRSIPGRGSWAGPIANMSCWPHQPQMGERIAPWCSDRT
jgi:hypothetical protein